MSEIINKVVPIDAISPHEENYNNHPETQLVQLGASYDDLDQFQSVVIWQRPGNKYTQVAGHGVVEAMQRKGALYVRADILPEDTDPLKVKRIMMASNLHAKNSIPDDTMLAQLLQEQQDAGFDLAALGTDDETLRQMLEALGDAYLGEQEDGAGGDEFDVNPDEEQTRVKLGDIWQLGRHKIACLDSRDPETLRTLFSDSSAQMVWSDPPYGIDIVATNGSVGGGEAYDSPFGGVKMRKGDVGGGASHMRKTGKPYLADDKGLGSIGGAKPFGSKNVRGSDGASNVVDVGKYFPVIGDDSTETAVIAYRLCADFFPQAIQIWWGANYYANALPPSKCWIVWDKENTGNFADAELAWCSDKSAVRIFKHMWNGMLKDSEHGQRRVHPTQKPIALAEWAFEKYGKENDVIYDPFLGSGMSVIAAENTNRTVYGCELSPEYIDVIVTRWEKHTGHTAQLLARIEEPAHV